MYDIDWFSFGPALFSPRSEMGARLAFAKANSNQSKPEGQVYLGSTAAPRPPSPESLNTLASLPPAGETWEGLRL
jgi:hypothetical protein